MNEHIQQMIDWIERHLKHDFSLDALSNYMGYSPYYCSFKFHQAAGISIRRYVLLRRLYLSTEHLANGQKILDIALEFRYSSQEAYSRAFKLIFGISPSEFQRKPMPVQSFIKLTVNKDKGWCEMDIAKKIEVLQLQLKNSECFDQDVLHLLNGQVMYEEFKDNKLMGNADYAPFNEAMCVHATTKQVFSQAFIAARASGHHDSVENYIAKVIDPLHPLFHKPYKCIVLWFGEDMFCQMNLLTMLAYLEQSGYAGRVFMFSFREDEFKVSETELTLGRYAAVYEEVLIRHQKPSSDLLPIMYQAANLYLDMLHERHAVVKYISSHKDLPTSELLINLFERFPSIGYGDTQYLELIHKARAEHS